jgi:hypothetical protein
LIKVPLKPATSGHSSTVTGGDQFPLRTPQPKGTQKKERKKPNCSGLFFLAKLGQLGTLFFFKMDKIVFFLGFLVARFQENVKEIARFLYWVLVSSQKCEGLLKGKNLQIWSIAKFD